MPDLRELLRRHGLDGHLDALRAQAIDAEILPDLTAEDIAGLGLPLGDRKRLARLAAEQRARRTRPLADLSELAGDFAQIRQMTVAFIDLVGSTELAEALDLEDYRALLAEFHRLCAEAVRARGGAPARFVGDAVLACFGHPRAAEDDAARAVAAAQEALRRLEAIEWRGRRLAARAGVATGSLMTLSHTDAALGPAVGPSLNLAARLEVEARPGEVLIDDRTRRLLPRGAAVEEAGRRAIRGFAEPVRLWRALVSAAAPGARAGPSETPLIGREEPLALLRARWRGVGRRGAMALLAGEAGIGKTRLLDEFLDGLGLAPERVLRAECSAQLSQRPLHPLSALLERVAGLDGAAGPEARLERLRRWAETALGEAGLAEALAPLAGGAPPAGPPAAAQAALFEAALSALERLCRAAPAVLAVEDLHWADATTLELLDALAARIDGQRLVAICTLRPDFTPAFQGRHGVTPIGLSRLDPEAGAAIVDALDPDRALTPPERAEVLQRAEGVPLFIEEMTRAALEHPPARADARGRAERRLPSTLAGSLTARLDRVPGAHRLAPVGAAIGRSFTRGLLLRAAEMEPAEAAPILDGLAAAGLLTREPEGGDTRLTFRHTLIQEAAYASMPRPRRIETHRRIAAALAEASGGVDAAPEARARHLQEAELWTAAREAWREAAEAAIARSASAEAIADLRAALETNAHLPPGPERDRCEIAIHERLMTPLGLTAWGSREIDRSLEALSALHRRTGDQAALLQTLVGQCGAFLIRAEAGRALDVSGRMASVALGDGGRVERLLALHYRAMSLFFLNRLEEAATAYEREIALVDPALRLDVKPFYVADPAVVARCMRAWALRLLHGPQAAPEAFAEALASFEAHPEPFTRAYGWGVLAACLQLEGDAERSAVFAGRSLEISRRGDEIRLPYWAAWAEILSGWGEALSGRPEIGVPRLQAGLAAYMEIGARQLVPLGQALLAEARQAAGAPQEAAQALEEAEAWMRRLDVPVHARALAAIRRRLGVAGAA